ncbi:CHAT domain-containing protein [Plectonema cf. radiosum LEGE 06105]|uniref:CHAT domain-containing protein n=1 Tax=Plectonema cf. radiosum LEGE 06105 TaxID=945769 RepID=A0A8J7F307_9CYAN|nr:CHAT domain-containing protein [Plectonema radiosum]MBE9213003.1 CHAT domain-containing protein [Plectonema cf. radiosum LEGE 06105]
MKMGLRKLIVIFAIALLLCVSQPLWLSLPMLFGGSVAVGQTNDERKAEAESLLQQALQQYNNRQYGLALQSLQKALAIYQRIKNGQGQIKVLYNLGSANEALGDYYQAVYYYNKSLVISQKNSDSEFEINALRDIILIYYFNLKQYAKAIEYLQKSLIVSQRINNHKIEIMSLRILTEAYEYLGNYTKVVEYGQKTLLKVRQVTTIDKKLEPQTLLTLGEAYVHLNDYRKAIDSYQESRVIARKIHNTEIEKKASLFLPPEPFSINYPINELFFLYRLGQHQYKEGEYKKALETFQKVLVITRELMEYSNEGYTLNEIGKVYYIQGKEHYPQALNFYEKALAIAKKIPDKKLEATVINSIGEIYIGQIYYGKAEKAFNQALKILRQLTVTGKELEANKELEAILFNNLGNIYGLQAKYSESLSFYKQALNIRKNLGYKSRTGEILLSIGGIYEKIEDYPKTLEAYQDALDWFKENNDKRGEVAARLSICITLTNLGLVNYYDQQYENAEKYLFDAITNWEYLRYENLSKLNDDLKISVVQDSFFTYSLLQKLLITQKKTDVALEVAERGRARTLIELILSNQSSQKLNIENIKLPTLDEIQKLTQAQKATVVYYSLIQDNRRYKVNSGTQFTKNSLYMWVIKPTGEITFRPVDLKPILQKENTTLEELVENTRDFIGVRDRSIFARTNSTTQNTTAKRAQFDIKVFPSSDDDPSKDLQKLHEILIDPIADLLPTDPNERVIFIPQNELFLVPFPALKDAQGKYLIEKHTILTAPSIQVLGLTHKRAKEVKLASVQNALVVGNPDMPSVAPKIGDEAQPLSKLPGAEKEAEAIKPLLEENKLKTKLLIDKQATKAAVLELLPQAKIIHLATHGLFDNIQGLQSAIALAPSGKDNGLLTAEEILNLKLNADLVVLSACNTGRGRITGDGVIGLSRSLISAGTPSVIVSLWAVPDAPTAELMTEFYKNLLNKRNPLDKAQALRQAMLKFKDKPPKDWAAFTLIGESN